MSGQSAAAKSNRKSKGGYKSGWKGVFIPYNLTKEDKERLGKLNLGSDKLLEWQDSMAASGYKVSFSFDPDRDTYTASLNDRDKESEFFECTLTARGKSLYSALSSLYYKHEIIFERTWVKPGQDDEEWG